MGGLGGGVFGGRGEDGIPVIEAGSGVPHERC